MTRSEVSEKQKWRLEDIFATNEAWETEYAFVKDNYKKVSGFKGKLGSREMLLECLRFMDKIEFSLLRLIAYSHMRKDEDSRMDLYVGMAGRAQTLSVQFGAECSFFTSEISALPPEYLNVIIGDKEFSDFNYSLQEIIRVKKHILSDKEEKILAMSGNALDGCHNAFSMLENVDLPLPTVTVNGKKLKLTFGKYSYFLFSGDAKTRKTVFKGLYGAFKSVINTFAALYAGSVKADNFYAEARGFKTALDRALYMNDIPKEVYNNLIKSVKSGLPAVHDYVAMRKECMGLKTMHMYDMYMPVVPDVEMSMDYEQAYNLVMEGLKPMGKEYVGLLKEAKDDRWIDVVETSGKRSGAYCFGCYGTHPFVLLNYSKTTHDIFTIAHEMGHAMHSYYSSKTQPFAKHNYQIFVAEVASTVNEVLLLKHLISTAKDKQTKAYLLNYYLDMFRTTLFRQTMFAEFEMLIHDMDRKGETLTVGSLSDTYYKLNKKYYGRAVKHDDEIRYEWSRIPHFYNAFYVYKYATGITSAVNIAKNILENPKFVDVYKNNFLSAGGKDSAFNILKSTGVDLTATAPFEVAMTEFRNTLAELKKTLAE